MQLQPNVLATGVVASAAKQSTWSFGELPELMEISKGGQSLIGFPALVDMGDGVSIEVFGSGGLTDVLLKKVRDETSLDVKRTDFKLEMLSAHFFMNFKVVDEHGRQLG